MGKLVLLTIILIIALAGVIELRGNLPIANRAENILSPLPMYLVNTTLAQSLGFWKPNDSKVLQSMITKPNVSAKAAFVYDITTDTVLYDKNARESLPVASLVKVMTAVVALETMQPAERIGVSSNASATGENSMGISTGETYTLEELLYGLVLHSGNDAAVGIAEAVGGTEAHFVELMNQKAQILGLSDTRFVNASGLEEDPPVGGQVNREYSTAYDLAILTKHALTLPTFAKVAETVEYAIAYSSEHKQLYFYNQTNLLTSYAGVKGVKTGYTPSAGLCLITYVENGGHRLIGVILNSERRREEMRELLDYSFGVLGVQIPARN